MQQRFINRKRVLINSALALLSMALGGLIARNYGVDPWTGIKVSGAIALLLFTVETYRLKTVGKWARVHDAATVSVQEYLSTPTLFVEERLAVANELTGCSGERLCRERGMHVRNQRANPADVSLHNASLLERNWRNVILCTR